VRLSQRVFFNHNLTAATKVSDYYAICLSILLYGCENWTPYRCHVKTLEAHYRLNGSSRHVLTATSLSYGKSKNSTHHKIKTPDPIKIKFGTVDYVGKLTPHAKFHVNPSKGGFPANG